MQFQPTVQITVDSNTHYLLVVRRRGEFGIHSTIHSVDIVYWTLNGGGRLRLRQIALPITTDFRSSALVISLSVATKHLRCRLLRNLINEGLGALSFEAVLRLHRELIITPTATGTPLLLTAACSSSPLQLHFLHFHYVSNGLLFALEEWV